MERYYISVSFSDLKNLDLELDKIDLRIAGLTAEEIEGYIEFFSKDRANQEN